MDDFVELKRRIPAGLFVKDEFRYMQNVLRAMVLNVLGLYIGVSFFVGRTPLHLIAYAMYQGTLFISLWVLGHDCGHGQFSHSRLKNDILGYVLHTLLLVPYFQWQHSHAIHHKFTGSCDHGETHVPPRVGGRSHRTLVRLYETLGEIGFVAYYLFNVLFLGWYLYLLFGLSGAPKRGFTSHFFVPNKLFTMDTRKKVVHYVLSMAGLGGVLYGLSVVAGMYGWSFVLQVYFAPYVVANMWLTGYTLLHHADDAVPYYREVNWFDGNLCTVDRPYCDLINWLHYDIGRYHVCHHLFPTMPHYHQKQATNVIREFLAEKYGAQNEKRGQDSQTQSDSTCNFRVYRYSDKSTFSALVDVARRCAVIAPHPDDPNVMRFVPVKTGITSKHA